MTYAVSVRTLAEFYYEGGDLSREENALNRMLEGMRGHMKLQSGYTDGMESEVPLALDAEAEGLRFHVQGRADGLRREPQPLIEEIKTVSFDPEKIEEGQEVHWAQAEIYAYFLYRETGLPVTVVLTYYALSGAKKSFVRERTGEELEALFTRYLTEFARFYRLVISDAERSAESMAGASFPYETMRPGQYKLMAQAYYAMKNGKNLMAEAPTGIGKTVSSLFPALKAMSEGAAERVFYLTARGTQRIACADALNRLRCEGVFVRSVEITAREKACPDPSVRCVPEECPYARGYYDRRRSALLEAFGIQELDADAIRRLAEKYTLCPFELSLDLSETAQVILCDYNYAFHPSIRLKRHFERKNQAALLIDEAHELCGRTREMLSASLDTRAIAEARRGIGKLFGRTSVEYKACTAFRKALLTAFSEAEGGETYEEANESVTRAAYDFTETLSDRRDRRSAAVSDVFFTALDYIRVAGVFDAAHSRELIERHGKELEITLYRFDPSEHLRKTFSRVGSAVLFSATMTPQPYYTYFSGLDPEGGDAYLRLGSPFPRENLFSAAVPVDVRYAARSDTLGDVVTAIADMARAKTGNYMACFPSFKYMNDAAERFGQMFPDIRILLQRSGMDETERAAYLDAFREDPEETLVGFCVLGGVFTEGVDLAGSRLIGAAVVTVGQPTPSLRGSVLAENAEEGYEAAYTYPGMTRAVQAAGRVIRGSTDKGVVLLIDRRYCTQKYRALLPEHMKPVRLDPGAVYREIRKFWEKADEPALPQQ